MGNGNKSHIQRTISLTQKKVHFNPQDGSNISPPNDRRPGSWADTWEDVCRIQDLLTSLHAVTQLCLKLNLVHVFEGLIKIMAYLSVRKNAINAVKLLRTIVTKTSPTFTVSSLTATLELWFPELCLVGASSGVGVLPLWEIKHNRTLLRCKAVWMSAAVLRYHLRWLLDAPPAVLSTPTGGGPAVVALTTNPDEANSHYRSQVWSSLDLVFDSQQDSLLFAFPGKDPRLEACIYAIDSSHSPSSGSNLSYLVAEALRQINTAASLSSSVSKAGYSVQNLLERGANLDKALLDLVAECTDQHVRVEIFQTFLAAESARLFVWSVLSQTPGIETACEVVEGRSGTERPVTAWEHMQRTAEAIVSLGLVDEDTHLHLLSRGFASLKTLVSVPLLSDSVLSRCRLELSSFYGHWLDQLLISYSAPKGVAKGKAAPKKRKSPASSVTDCGISSATATYDMAGFDDMLSGKPILKFPLVVLKGGTVISVTSVFSDCSVAAEVPLGAFSAALASTEETVILPDESVPIPDVQEEDEMEAEVRGKASRRRRSVSASQVVREVAAAKEKAVRKPPAVRVAVEKKTTPAVVAEIASISVILGDSETILRMVNDAPVSPTHSKALSVEEDTAPDDWGGDQFPQDDDWSAAAMFSYDPESVEVADTLPAQTSLATLNSPVSARPKRRASISATERIRTAAGGKNEADSSSQRSKRRGANKEVSPVEKEAEVVEIDTFPAAVYEEEQDEEEGPSIDLLSEARMSMCSAMKQPRGRRSSMSPAAALRRGHSYGMHFDEAKEEEEEEEEEDVHFSALTSHAADRSFVVQSAPPSPAKSVDVSMCSTVPEDSEFLLASTGAVFSYDPDLDQDDDHLARYSPVPVQPANTDSSDQRAEHKSERVSEPFNGPTSVDDVQSDWLVNPEEEAECGTAAIFHYDEEEAPDPVRLVTLTTHEVGLAAPVVIAPEVFSVFRRNEVSSSSVISPLTVVIADKKKTSKARRASIAPVGRKKATTEKVRTENTADDSQDSLKQTNEALPEAAQFPDIPFDLAETFDDEVQLPSSPKPVAARSKTRRASFTSASQLISRVASSSRPRRGLVVQEKSESSEDVADMEINAQKPVTSISMETVPTADKQDVFTENTSLQEPVESSSSVFSTTIITTTVSSVAADKKKASKGRRASIAPAGRKKSAKSVEIEEDSITPQEPGIELQQQDVDTTVVDDFSFPCCEEDPLEDVFAGESAIFEYDPSQSSSQQQDSDALVWKNVQLEEEVVETVASSKPSVRTNRRASFTSATERIRSATTTRRGAGGRRGGAAKRGVEDSIADECVETHLSATVSNLSLLSGDESTSLTVAKTTETTTCGAVEEPENDDSLSRQETFVPAFGDLFPSSSPEGFPDDDCEIAAEDNHAPVVKAEPLISGRAKLSRRASVCASEKIRSFAETLASPPLQRTGGRDQQRAKRKMVGSPAPDLQDSGGVIPVTQDDLPVETSTSQADVAIYFEKKQEESKASEFSRRQAKETASSKIAQLAVVKRAADSKRSRQRMRAIVKKQVTTSVPSSEKGPLVVQTGSKMSSVKQFVSVDEVVSENKENEFGNKVQDSNSGSNATLSSAADGKTPSKSSSSSLRAPLSCKRVPLDMRAACMERTPDKASLAFDRFSPAGCSEQREGEDDMLFSSGMMHWNGEDDGDFMY
eukprot:gene23474-29691_t